VAALRETDALCVVLRAFGPDPKPANELTELTAELIRADLANGRAHWKTRGSA
jgi:hypothetical protein